MSICVYCSLLGWLVNSVVVIACTFGGCFTWLFALLSDCLLLLMFDCGCLFDCWFVCFEFGLDCLC